MLNEIWSGLSAALQGGFIGWIILGLKPQAQSFYPFGISPTGPTGRDPFLLRAYQALRTWLLSLRCLRTEPKFSTHRIIEAVVIDLESDLLRHPLHDIVLGQYVSKDEFNPFVPAYLD
jgi:hypothetical protein